MAPPPTELLHAAVLLYIAARRGRRVLQTNHAALESRSVHPCLPSLSHVSFY